MSYWAVIHTKVQAETDARRSVEALGYGAFLPYYKQGYWRGEQLRFREKPLLPRYVLAKLPEGAEWSTLNHADGVGRILMDAGTPARVSDAEVASLMLAHARGAYNTAPPRRDAAGRFRKHKKRRRRPRHGKIATGLSQAGQAT